MLDYFVNRFQNEYSVRVCNVCSLPVWCMELVSDAELPQFFCKVPFTVDGKSSVISSALPRPAIFIDSRMLGVENMHRSTKDDTLPYINIYWWKYDSFVYLTVSILKRNLTIARDRNEIFMILFKNRKML